MSRILQTRCPVPVQDTFRVEWIDEDGIKRRVWVEAANYNEACTIANTLACGSVPHIYQQRACA